MNHTTQPPLRVEQALRLLPDVDALVPLRGFLISRSQARPSVEPHGTVGKRTVQPSDLKEFIHQAIEWENLLYFLYPYFWGSELIGRDKILFEHELFGHQRFLMQMSVGTMPHAKIMRSIELFGSEVAPAVKRATAMGRTL